MDCCVAQNLISAVADGEASADDRSALEEHVAVCADCAEQLAAARELDDDLRRLFAVERGAAARLAEQVSSRLAQQSETVAVPAVHAAAPAAIGRSSSHATWRQVASWLAAMAAGFLIAVLVFQPWKKLVEVRPYTAREGSSSDGSKTGGETVAGAKRPAENASHAAPTPVAHLVVATGDVSIRHAAQSDWAAASCSSAPPARAVLRSAPSRECAARCKLPTAA